MCKIYSCDHWLIMLIVDVTMGFGWTYKMAPQLKTSSLWEMFFTKGSKKKYNFQKEFSLLVSIRMHKKKFLPKEHSVTEYWCKDFRANQIIHTI